MVNPFAGESGGNSGSFSKLPGEANRAAVLLMQNWPVSRSTRYGMAAGKFP
ncbi:MAG: hypothetical protein P1P82_15580 [Bacteroidales bacterium]|nr:hypothetical protein [Bacteroidales bacterium]